MTKQRACACSTPLASEQVEKIAQLALAGQAALTTSLDSPHVSQAAASLFEIINEISDELVQRLQEQEMQEQY